MVITMTITGYDAVSDGDGDGDGVECVAPAAASSSCVVLSGQSSKLLTSNCRTLWQGEDDKEIQLVHKVLKDVWLIQHNLGVVLARSNCG